MIPRTEWEEPGWTVAEHTNSPPVDWSKVVGVTIHYPGSSGTWTRTPTRDQVIDRLRSSQRSYVNSRGYSYGYNFQVWGEHVGVVRGSDFRNAANGNTALNTPRISIQVRVPGLNDTGQPATGDEIARVNEIIAWAEQQAGRRLFVDGHRDNKPTGCPGGGLYAQIQAGVFHATHPTPPENDMGLPYIRINGYADQFKAVAMSAESKRRNGDDDVPVLVVDSDKSRAELEAAIGYTLTPYE